MYDILVCLWEFSSSTATLCPCKVNKGIMHWKQQVGYTNIIYVDHGWFHFLLEKDLEYHYPIIYLAANYNTTFLSSVTILWITIRRLALGSLR